MISLKVPLGDKVTWLVMHELSLVNEPDATAPIRPIHLLTFVGTELPTKDSVSFIRLLHRLELKLFAVHQYAHELAASYATVGDPQTHGDAFKDYEPDAVFVSSLEQFLRAVDDALEIAGTIARAIDVRLPKGFRSQARKFKPFTFEQNAWLAHFFDVKLEVLAFGNALPFIEPPHVVLEFPDQRELLHFRTGRHSVPLDEILAYEAHLLDLLDGWAEEVLPSIPPDAILQRHEVDRGSRTTRVVRVPASELLSRLDRRERGPR